MAIDVELMAWRQELQRHREKVAELERELHALKQRVQHLEAKKPHAKE